MTGRFCTITAGLSKVELSNDWLYCYKINNATNSIKISHTFTLVTFRQYDYYLNTILPKMDLRQTKEITIYIEIALKQNILDKILQPSLEKLGLKCYYEDVDPVLLAFQRCPKLKEIDIFFWNCNRLPFKRQNVLKEIVKTKRENKIERFNYNSMPEFDFDDFMNFINNHLSPTCYIRFGIEVKEVFDELKIMLKMAKKNREKESNIEIEIHMNGYFPQRTVL
uniref:Uncharacterized protein n=1 Tax=Panagrolaimus superbus TaxID=310955 RepID=A0A914YS60_9BILA